MCVLMMQGKDCVVLQRRRHGARVTQRVHRGADQLIAGPAACRLQDGVLCATVWPRMPGDKRRQRRWKSCSIFVFLIRLLLVPP